MKKMNGFGWKVLSAKWCSEDAFRVLALMKENRIRCRMPSDDVFFASPYHLLPGAVRRWQISVRRRDWERAEALLEREGLANKSCLDDADGSPVGTGLPVHRTAVPQPLYTGMTRSLPPSYSA